MKIIGHRGARGYAPENTLISMQKAVDLDVDMVEFDVYALPSGEVLLMHDHRIDRTTDGTGRIMHQQFNDLRALNAGEGEKIPILQEVLDLIDGRIGINIELKGRCTAKLVAAIIEKYLTRAAWTPEHFLVSSFDHHELRDFKQSAPHIAIATLEHTVPLTYAAGPQEQGAQAVNPNHEFLTQEYVDDAHKRGLKVYPYTVNEVEDALELQQMGVDGVVTDYPDIMRSALSLPVHKANASTPLTVAYQHG